MKTYRLVSWPDLPAEFQRTSFRRALSELSMREVSVEHLSNASGLRRSELVALLERLESQDLLVESDQPALPSASWFGRLRRSVAASPWAA
jgi:Tat protein secretion system quality control protein TatD with DNase activity